MTPEICGKTHTYGTLGSLFFSADTQYFIKNLFSILFFLCSSYLLIFFSAIHSWVLNIWNTSLLVFLRSVYQSGIQNCYFLKLNWEQKDPQPCLALPFWALCLWNNVELTTENRSFKKGRGELHTKMMFPCLLRQESERRCLCSPQSLPKPQHNRICLSLKTVM